MLLVPIEHRIFAKRFKKKAPVSQQGSFSLFGASLQRQFAIVTRPSTTVVYAAVCDLRNSVIARSTKS